MNGPKAAEPKADITSAQFRASILGNGAVVGQLNIGQVYARMSLVQAMNAVRALASRALPNGSTISWWPLKADETQVVHVSQILNYALAIICVAALTEKTDGPASRTWVIAGTGVLAFVRQMHGRVIEMQAAASGDARAATTTAVQSDIQNLAQMLPASDHPQVAELDAQMHADMQAGTR